MCVTLRPSRLSETFIYAGDAYHPVTQEYIHVLAYQNRAENRDPRPNAMILPIPATSLAPENAIDMRGHDSLLKDMAQPLLRMDTELELKRTKAKPAESFSVGSYTVVITTKDNVAGALASLPDSKRPQFNRDIFKAYAELYPDWQIAICCWEGKIRPEPLFWWYKPLNPQVLFYPTLDAHNGKAPDLQRDVMRDHVLMVGSKVQPFGILSKVADYGPAASYLPNRVWGRQLNGSDFNRDYTMSVANTRQIKNAQGAYDLHARLDPRIWDLDFEYRRPRKL